MAKGIDHKKARVWPILQRKFLLGHSPCCRNAWHEHLHQVQVPTELRNEETQETQLCWIEPQRVEIQQKSELTLCIERASNTRPESFPVAEMTFNIHHWMCWSRAHGTLSQLLHWCQSGMPQQPVSIGLTHALQ